MDGKRKSQIATMMAENTTNKEILVNIAKANKYPEFTDTLFFLAKIHP